MMTLCCIRWIRLVEAHSRWDRLTVRKKLFPFGYTRSNIVYHCLLNEIDMFPLILFSTELRTVLVRIFHYLIEIDKWEMNENAMNFYLWILAANLYRRSTFEFLLEAKDLHLLIDQIASTVDIRPFAFSSSQTCKDHPKIHRTPFVNGLLDYTC